MADTMNAPEGPFEFRDSLGEFRFHVRREHGSDMEVIEITATDAEDAIRQLPKCVSWDFAPWEDGYYRKKVASLRLPDEWAKIDGLAIHDPDGWRPNAPLGEKSMSEPITYDEYRQRMFISTVGPRRV